MSSGLLDFWSFGLLDFWIFGFVEVLEFWNSIQLSSIQFSSVQSRILCIEVARLHDLGSFFVGAT